MVMDSAFVAYLIIRGFLWMSFILAWLSFAHYLGIKNKNYRLIVVSTFFLVLCVMERPGLDAWYNYVLFYPLAIKDVEDIGIVRHLFTSLFTDKGLKKLS